MRLQTERIDFYLLHALDAERWPKMRDLGVLDWAERAMADGRIGHLGFSFHDKYEAFQEIVDAYDGWTFCQIQYNYMDEQEQAGVRGLNYAADKGLAVVVMEPLRGGMLAGDVPESVQAIWDVARGSAFGRGLGAAMAVEPARRVVGAQRDDHDGAGRAEHRQR